MGTTERDDRVLLATRVVAVVIVPFLVIGSAVLYVWPSDTGKLFAWSIAPRMTALFMGAGYAAGCYFFVRTAWEQRWHRVAVAFLPVATFATLMGVATVLHWDRFNHQHIMFFGWTGLYATTPFLVLGTWLRNRMTESRAPDVDDAVVPTGVRAILGVVGGGVLIWGLILFVNPGPMIAAWPWRLTPLTARVVCGFLFAIPGAFGLGVAADARWSTARIALQGQMLWAVLTLIGVVRAWSDFASDNALTRVFVAAMAGLVLGGAALYVSMESRRQLALRSMAPYSGNG